jgi:hypothetical protein
MDHKGDIMIDRYCAEADNACDYTNLMKGDLMTHIRDYYRGSPEQPTQLILRLRHIDPFGDEYSVEWWQDGIYREGPTYYTDDIDDARSTQEVMMQHALSLGMIVRCIG